MPGQTLSRGLALLFCCLAGVSPAKLPGASVEEASTPAYVARTAQTRRLSAEFLDLLYAKMDVRAAFTKFVAPAYIQHNPGMVDGRDAAIRALEPLFRNPDTRISVKQVLVDGDRTVVEIVGQKSPQDAGSVVMNIFRWEGDKIVEHWDVTQAITGSTPSGHPPY